MGLLVAAYVVRSLWARPAEAPVMATRNMPTPVVDIPAGTEITEKHLGNAPIPVKDLKADMLANRTIIVGRVVREPLLKAVPIRANQLYAPGEKPKLKLAKGKIAQTVALDTSVSIVDGLIRPNDYCDIRYTLNPSFLRSDVRTSQAMQMTLFKGIKVLAINRNVVQQSPDANGNTVTLEVSPGQANAVLLARAYGTLNLSYTEDPTPGGIEISDDDTVPLTIEKLLNLPVKPEPVAQKPPEPYTVDEYRHLRRTTISFAPNGRVMEGYNYYNANGQYQAPLNRNRAVPGVNDWGASTDVNGTGSGANSTPVAPMTPMAPNTPSPSLPPTLSPPPALPSPVLPGPNFNFNSNQSFPNVPGQPTAYHNSMPQRLPQ